MHDIKAELRRYIEDNFIMGAGGVAIADADSFLEHHVLDSTGFLELIGHIEETWGIKVLDDEMVPSLARLGFASHVLDNPLGPPFLVAERIEDPALLTVLIYGHGDTVRGLDDLWRPGLSPWTLTVEGDRLYGQPTGQSKEELIPESETVFNVTNVGAKVTFVKDASGKVTHALINFQGQEIQAKKIK